MKKVFFTLMMLVSIAFCQNENQSIRQIKPNYSRDFRQNRQRFEEPTIIGNKMEISIVQDGVIFMKKANELKLAATYIPLSCGAFGTAFIASSFKANSFDEGSFRAGCVFIGVGAITGLILKISSLHAERKGIILMGNGLGVAF